MTGFTDSSRHGVLFQKKLLSNLRSNKIIYSIW